VLSCKKSKIARCDVNCFMNFSILFLCCFVLWLLQPRNDFYWLLRITSQVLGGVYDKLSYVVTLRWRFGFDVFCLEMVIEWKLNISAVNTSEINRRCRVTTNILLFINPIGNFERRASTNHVSSNHPPVFVLPSEGSIRERSMEPPWSPSENAQMDFSNSTQCCGIIRPVSIRERSVDASGPIPLSCAPDILVLFALYHFFG
jgi:hypothetical protein